MTNLAYCNVTSNASEALTQAYEFQLTAIKTQVRFETMQDSYDLRIKQLEQENTRQWWLTIACVVALGYGMHR